MTDRVLPYYKWFWQDWRSNRRVQRMSYIERGLYRELLDECWVEGSIPNNVDELADICGCPSDVMATAWRSLCHCFVCDGDRWRNEKLDSLRTELDQRRIKNAENGRKGGIAKAAQTLASVANAKQPLSDRHIEEKRREEEEGEKRQKQKRASALPDDFQPSQPHYNLALSIAVNLDEELAKFRDYHQAKGSVMKDWDAALRTWIRNAAEFNKRPTPGQRVSQQQRLERNNQIELEDWLAEASGGGNHD